MYDKPGFDQAESMNEPKPRAVIRGCPSDFVVDEIAAYEPSGAGDHLYVHFRKTTLDTPAAVRAIGAALGIEEPGSWAGMKDRHAVTTQWASFPCPAGREIAEAALADIERVEVLRVARHMNKLKTGHLRGNRFTIGLRELDPEALSQVEADLSAIKRDGVPNAFGSQRFGRDGDNPERAIAFLSGAERAPRSKKLRRLLFSALQSKLFNLVLDKRVADGSWIEPIEGDLAQKHDSGGVFRVGAADLEDARTRARRGELSPTGPMFGAKMRKPEGLAADIEAEVLATLDDPALLSQHKRLGQGARRALRLPVEDMRWELATKGNGVLRVSFVLPKGGYATTVLSTVCSLEDATRRETTPA